MLVFKISLMVIVASSSCCGLLRQLWEVVRVLVFIRESAFIRAPRNGLCGQVWVSWNFNVALSNILFFSIHFQWEGMMELEHLLEI
jgi:hypothetical protein